MNVLDDLSSDGESKSMAGPICSTVRSFEEPIPYAVDLFWIDTNALIMYLYRTCTQSDSYLFCFISKFYGISDEVCQSNLQKLFVCFCLYFFQFRADLWAIIVFAVQDG